MNVNLLQTSKNEKTIVILLYFKSNITFIMMGLIIKK